MKKHLNKIWSLKNAIATVFVVLGIVYLTRIITPTYVETSILYFAFAWFLYSTKSINTKIK